MLGKLRPSCLWKYVRGPFLRGRRWQSYVLITVLQMVTCTHLCYFSLASCRGMTHNYTDTNTSIFPGELDGKGIWP